MIGVDACEKSGQTAHYDDGLGGADAAALRRQAGQRQSSACAAGIGSLVGSAAHQQSPPRPQSKRVPQRAQARRRDVAAGWPSD